MHLVRVQDVNDREERPDLDSYERLFWDSRAAASCSVSLFSMKPAGTVQNPRRGSIARLQSRMRPACSGTQPTTSLGF
jgi:hypothetical protein